MIVRDSVVDSFPVVSSCGGKHSLIVMSDGDLYVCGKGVGPQVAAREKEVRSTQHDQPVTR